MTLRRNRRISRTSSKKAIVKKRWRVLLLNKSALRPDTVKLLSCLRKISSAIDSPALPSADCEISFLWNNNSEIKHLNKNFRRKSKATDVLSFSQIEGKIKSLPDSALLGDIVISVEKAKTQAKQFKVSLQAELLRISIHGILHLFGYDHERVSKQKALRMQKMEEKLFEKYFALWQHAWKVK